MKTIWVVAADHVRARFFQVESSSAPLEEIDTLVHSEGRLHDRDITSDLPGKVKNPGGHGGGQAFEQETDPKKYEAEVFAREIVHYLENARNAHRFDRLIVIADVHFGFDQTAHAEPAKRANQPGIGQESCRRDRG
jgi:protein required for attachment to host cells